MAGRLTPRGQAKISALDEVQRSIQSIHKFTEQFAASRERRDADQYSHNLKRQYARLKRRLMAEGLDVISQLAGAMEVAAGRSSSQMFKSRVLREGLASIRFQIDFEVRRIRQEETVVIQRDDETDGDEKQRVDEQA